MKKGNLLMLLVGLIYPSSTLAHDEDLRSPNLKPRIGLMSEQVVRAKFQSYGVKITELKRVGRDYHVQAMLDGKVVPIKLDALTGSTLKENALFRLEPSPTVSDRVIKADSKRVPWMERAVRFNKMGVRGMTPPGR